jgi:hypothetical protein
MRGGGAVAVAGVLVLVALGGWQASHARPTPRAVPTPQARPTPPDLPPPVGFGAPRLVGHTGLRLLIGADQLGEYEVDSDRTRPVGGVPGPATGLFAVEGGTVVTGAGPLCRACVLYVVPDGSRAARPLGRYDGAVPAALPGLIWAYRTGTATTPGIVRLLDLAGQARGPVYRLPVTRVPVRGTVAGLLLHRVDVGYTEVSLWDPPSDQLSPVYGDILAVSANSIVFGPTGCVDPCLLGWKDLRTNHYQQVPIPGLPVAAAFDPSGQVLAVAAALLDHDANPVTTLYLARTDRIQEVSDSTVHSNHLALCWSKTRLVAALTPADDADGPLYLATATLAAPRLHRLGRPTGRTLPTTRCN